MQVLSENSERPVSQLAETDGLIDRLHRDEVGVQEVKHLKIVVEESKKLMTIQFNDTNFYFQVDVHVTSCSSSGVPLERMQPSITSHQTKNLKDPNFSWDYYNIIKILWSLKRSKDLNFPWWGGNSKKFFFNIILRETLCEPQSEKFIPLGISEDSSHEISARLVQTKNHQKPFEW